MKKHDGVCTGCSTGCSITVEENQDHVYRLKPRENPHVNQWWMCDEGRYGYHHVHSDRPADRTSNAATAANWIAARMVAGGCEIDERFRAMWAGVAVVLSPHLTVEEAYLLGEVCPRRRSAGIGRAGPGAGRRADEKIQERLHDPRRKVPEPRAAWKKS